MTTTSPTGTELDQTLKATVTRLLEIREARLLLDAEEANLKNIVRTHIPPGQAGTVNGEPVVTVSVNRRFNPDLAQKALPAELLTLITVPTVHGPTAKKTLPPALYEACMAEVGEPVVRLT